MGNAENQDEGTTDNTHLSLWNYLLGDSMLESETCGIFD